MRLALIPLFHCSLLHAQDLSGTWKTIDDKTGYARAEVQISKQKNGQYTGKIIKVHAIPNRPAISHCEKCSGTLKMHPYLDCPYCQVFSKILIKKVSLFMVRCSIH